MAQVHPLIQHFLLWGRTVREHVSGYLNTARTEATCRIIRPVSVPAVKITEEKYTTYLYNIEYYVLYLSWNIIFVLFQ